MVIERHKFSEGSFSFSIYVLVVDTGHLVKARGSPQSLIMSRRGNVFLLLSPEYTWQSLEDNVSVRYPLCYVAAILVE